MTYHYINISVRGSYYDCDYELTVENGHEIGTTYEDYLNSKWVLLSFEQYEFKEQNPNASVKEVLDMQIVVPSAEQLLAQAINNKIRQLYVHRQSSAVRILMYNGQGIWIEESDRLALKDKCNTVARRGQENVMVGSVYMNPKAGVLVIEKMEEYDDLCDAETKKKEEEIRSLTTKEDVEAVNIETGWPVIVEVTQESVVKELNSILKKSAEYQAVEFTKQIINEFSMPAKLALERQILFPVWGAQGAEHGKPVKVEFRFNHKADGEAEYTLYEVIKDHTLAAEWIPGAGTESLYKVVEVEHSGTKEDPIPWKLNMEVFNGKYYTEYDAEQQKDILYLGIRDSGQGMSFMLKDLISAGYVQVVV